MAPKPLFNHKAGACCHDSGERPGHVRGQQTGETPSPIPAMGNMPMALNVQMVLSENKLIGEKIVTPRIVNQQTLDYDAFCDYLAQGSTVTAARGDSSLYGSPRVTRMLCSGKLFLLLGRDTAAKRCRP